MAPLIVLILYYWPKIGVIWNILLIILGSLIGLIPKIMFKIPHLFESYKTMNFDIMTKTLSHHYWGVEPHVQVYALGILIGYLVRRHPNVYLGGRISEVLIWSTSWSLTIYALFWHKNYFNYTKYTVTQKQMYNWIIFSKLCYAVGWSWALYAMCTQRAGMFDNTIVGV